MWICPKCSEQHTNAFQVCWNCGTARDGSENPHFQPVEDSTEAPLSPRVRQFSIRAMFACLTSTSIALALARFSGPVLAALCGALITSAIYAWYATESKNQRLVVGYLCFMLLFLIAYFFGLLVWSLL